MRDVVVDKTKLIEVLEANRDMHRTVVEDAWVGFRKKAVEVLDERMKEAKKGLKTNLYVALVIPEDHTTDYDRVLGMLDMDKRDEVTLTEKEYAQFVDDDWGWKGQWETTNSSYSSLVMPADDDY